MKLNNVAVAARLVVSDTIRRPRKSFNHVRILGATLLDEEFKASSPIPLLGNSVLSRIYQSEVVLPPVARLQGGNQSIAGLIFLVSIAKTIGAQRIFEIGTYNGVTAWCLARNTHNTIVDTLDLAPEEAPALPLGETDASNRRSFHRRAYPLPNGSGEVVQHWGDSATFDFHPWGSACDLVYIDGAHSEQYVRSDTANAIRMVSPKGIIVWDDYWRRISGVKSVLDCLEFGNLYRVPSTRLVVHLSEGAQTAIRDCDPADAFDHLLYAL